MFNLFDMLQAQGGTGVQGFGQQFGLSPDQTRRAMEALLPAFTIGLQRNATDDPTGLSKMFGLAGASAPSAPPQMDAFVKQLFGSPHLSQAVLQQAAAVSGVATPALKQMLPAMAGMVVAGIVHVMINQNQAAPAPAPSVAPQSPFGFPASPYWTEMMNAFLSGGGSLVPGAAPAAQPSARGAASGAKTLAARRPSARAEKNAPGTPAGETPFDVFQQMFQTGIEAQQENAHTMQKLFDTMWRETDSAGSPAGAAAARSGKPGKPGR